jgi:diguanylate cyclase (GGDEF)-like protein/PAS domain S-box-containing protein
MDFTTRIEGAAVDERLAPAGLTRLLGSYRAGRTKVLATAVALFVAAGVAMVFVPSSPVTAGIVFLIPVAIIASELGTRAGLVSAALSIAIVLGWSASGLSSVGPTAVLPRSVALVFLAWIIGRTSERAAQSRALLEHVLEATTDSIYIKDLAGRYLLVNSAAAELIGRSGAEIIGRTNAELVPEVAQGIAERDAAVLEQLAPSTYEMSGRFGGRHFDLSVTKSPFRDATGTAIGSLGIARDITEQYHLRERFRRAFEDAPIGMTVADLEGRFLDVNQALCAITGYSRDELCARTFASITHPDDLAADYAVIEALVAGRLNSSTDEKRYLRPDGSMVWVARSVTLVRDANGAPLHFIDQIQDITDRRRYERELRRLADHDPLTGLLNRRRFEEELDRHVADVARYGQRGALLVLDLDRFKDVNDTLGHHAGDELILSVAALLRERLRGNDIIARLGGDEFAVLLPHAAPDDAEAVGTALVRAVRERAVAGDGDGDRGWDITTSVGIAPFHRTDASREEMLIDADLAMYEAKEAGGDRIATASMSQTRPIASTNPQGPTLKV